MLPNIPAVGRIEVHSHPRGIDWIGTGWLIHDNVVVTNRHVAEIFGDSDGTGFLFRPGIDGTPMQARIDFLEEFDNSSSQEFPLFRILNLETGGGPDLAFLRIEPVSGQSLPRPVLVSTVPARPGEHVAVIGYPARDPFFPNQDLMKRIFHDRYDKKRFAPGLVTGTTADRVFHDCSTLGGNSAAVVILLNTGLAVALHFAGTLFRKNHAVPMDVVVSRLEGVLSGRSRPVSGTLPEISRIRPIHSRRWWRCRMRRRHPAVPGTSKQRFRSESGWRSATSSRVPPLHPSPQRPPVCPPWTFRLPMAQQIPATTI